MDSIGQAQQIQNQSTKKQIPEAARGLCWGGFFLNWIWAIGNQTWIGLLTLVPLVGFIMPFVLLFKGREWAWKNGNWQSVDHFNSTQKTWSIVGIVISFFAIVPMVGIIAAIAIPNFARFQSKAKQTEAKIQLTTLYTGEQLVLAEGGAFSTDLQKLGVDPRTSPHYEVGFASTSETLAAQCADCAVGEKSFKAVAVGYPAGPGKPDVWTIDQDRNLVNVIDGTH